MAFQLFDFLTEGSWDPTLGTYSVDLDAPPGDEEEEEEGAQQQRGQFGDQGQEGAEEDERLDVGPLSLATAVPGQADALQGLHGPRGERPAASAVAWFFMAPCHCAGEATAYLPVGIQRILPPPLKTQRMLCVLCVLRCVRRRPDAGVAAGAVHSLTPLPLPLGADVSLLHLPLSSLPGAQQRSAAAANSQPSPPPPSSSRYADGEEDDGVSRFGAAGSSSLPSSAATSQQQQQQQQQQRQLPRRSSACTAATSEAPRPSWEGAIPPPAAGSSGRATPDAPDLQSRLSFLQAGAGGANQLTPAAPPMPPTFADAAMLGLRPATADLPSGLPSPRGSHSSSYPSTPPRTQQGAGGGVAAGRASLPATPPSAASRLQQVGGADAAAGEHQLQQQLPHPMAAAAAQQQQHQAELQLLQQQQQRPQRFFFAVDALAHPALAATPATRFFHACWQDGLHFDVDSRLGVIFNLSDK